MSDIEKIIKMAEENALLRKALSDLLIVLLSGSERSPIISAYNNETLNLVFIELYKLKGWKLDENYAKYKA